MTEPDWRPPHPSARVLPPGGVDPSWPPARPEQLVVAAAPSPATPSPATPSAAPDGAPPNPFTVLHARWLPLVAVLGLIALYVMLYLASRAFGSDIDDGELVSTLLYVPLLGWVGYAAWRHQVRLRTFFRWPRIGAYWWAVVGMTLAVFGFSIGASNITAALFPDFVSAAEVSPSAGFLVLIVTLAVIPPVVEELIFRGMLLERWAAKWRLGVAIIVQAIFFAILHVDPVGAGVFGVVMAVMYLRTRSLWAPIVMHAINNGVVVLVVLAVGDIEVDPTPTPLAEAIGVGLAFMAVTAPFIGVFLYRNWPTAQTLTPYEEFHYGPRGLPPRRTGPVDVLGSHAGALGRGRLSLGQDHLLVSRDRRGREVLSWAPYSTIAFCGVDQDFRVVQLRAGDGSALTLSLPQRSRRIRTGIVRAIGDRTIAWAGVEPVWSAPAIG